MKTLLYVIFSVSLVLTAAAQSLNPPPVITLGWTPAPGAATNTAGYWLWQGTNSGSYTRALFVPGAATSTATLTNVVRGQTYFWNITALGTNSAVGLESVFDGEATTTIPTPPAPPTSLRIQ